MRVISSGNPNTCIKILDKPGDGGASHVYEVLSTTKLENDPAVLYCSIKFQKGPIREAGVNGCHQEDLLAIIIDRLRSFQEGPFPCRENAFALTKCEEAMHWLNHRTAERTKRGVEGITKA